MTISAFSDPISTGNPAQSVNLPTLDYTDQDYGAMKRYLVTLASRMFGDRYNNFTEQDFGVMLIEFIASMFDKQSLKIDVAAAEAFYPTAIQPKSIRRHARRWNYTPTPVTASRYQMSARVVRPYDVDVIIPSGFQLATGGSDGRLLFLELFAADDDMNPIEGVDIVLPAGTESVTNIVGIEGQSTTIDGDGNGQPFQSFSMPEENVIPDSVRMFVDGTEWSRVGLFNVNGPQKVFKVDSDDRTRTFFVVVGDDVSGSVVPAGSRVTVRYRTGGGQRGNVPSGFIDVSQAIAVKGTNVSATITFSNIGRGYGGGDEETVEEIRRNLPYWIASQDRLITLGEYTNGCSKYASPAGRVAVARAYLRSAGCSANIIDVFVLENGLNDKTPVPPSDRLIRAVREWAEDRNVCNHHLCVRRGTVVQFDVRVNLTLPTASAFRKNSIETLAATGIDAYFAIKLWNFGLPLVPTDLARYLATIIPQAIVEVRFEMYPGFSLSEDGSYKSRHYELPRPVNTSVTMSWSNDGRSA